MRIGLRYGSAGLRLELPDAWDITILSKKPLPRAVDPRALIAAALAGPIGARPLREEARGARQACILVCDVTRPVPNGLALRPIVEQLIEAGLGPERITVLVATGLHRPNEGAELERLIGDPWVLAHVRTANHFARRDAEHVRLGTTSQAIPIALDARFVAADMRIVVGLVEPHFMAGWSGGRKLLVPGIAHADTIAAFHSAGMLGHPRAATCSLAGNPLHAAQLEAAGMVGRSLALNLVIDESRAPCFASFGEIEASHQAAVDFADPYFRIPVNRRFPTVLAGAAGFPLDATFYQTVKGFCCGAAILQPGGDLFVASECSEGFGSPEFREAQKRLRENGPAAFRAETRSRPRALVDEWQTVMYLKALEAGRLHLFTKGLSDEEITLTCAERVSDLVESLRVCVERDPARRLAVIPEGPYVAPEAP